MLNLIALLALSAEPEPSPPPLVLLEEEAEPIVVRREDGRVCVLTVDDAGQSQETCRERGADYGGKRLHAASSEPERAPIVIEDGEDLREPDDHPPNSQFGFAAFLGGRAAISEGGDKDGKVFGFVAAAGLRYGLRQRQEAGYMAMPSIAALIGATITSAAASPFFDVRAELTAVSPDGPLQPNFAAYGLSGVSLTHGAFQPHVGFGLGWNWLPKGSTGFSLGNLGTGDPRGAALLLVILPMILAGHVEARYTFPTPRGGDGFAALLVGIGA